MPLFLVVAEEEVRGVAVWRVVVESCEWIADSTANANDLQKAVWRSEVFPNTPLVRSEG